MYSFAQGNLSPKTLENFQLVATQLNALHISLNIVIYASLNPPYMVELFAVLQVIFCKFTKEKKTIGNDGGGQEPAGPSMQCFSELQFDHSHVVEKKDDDNHTGNGVSHCMTIDEIAAVEQKRKCSHVAEVCLVHGGTIQICVTTTINDGDGERDYKVCTCVNISNLTAIEEVSNNSEGYDDCKTLCQNKY